MYLNISVLSPKEVLFEGRAMSVVLPGEEGVFEILPFHKRLVTRLVSGMLFIDEKRLPVKRGIAKVIQNRVTVIVEEA